MNRRTLRPKGSVHLILIFCTLLLTSCVTTDHKVTAKNNADTFVVRTENAIELKKFDIAISDFTKAINLDPGYVPAYIGRGRCYGLKGRFKKALKDLDKAVQLEDSNP